MQNNTHDHDQHELEQKKSNRPVIQRNRAYWKSFEDLNDTSEFKESLETEFLSSPLRAEAQKEGDSDKWARREFLKLMGASMALTTAAGCIRRPVQKLVPYAKQPEEVTLGVSNWYSSTYFDGQEGLGLLIKSREGRPVHIQGNPSNPLNKGAVSSRAQASLLSLYDPERLQAPARNLFNEKRSNKETVHVSWEDLDKKAVEEIKKGSVYILTGAVASPATQAVIDDFGKAFGAQHVTWEPLSHEDISEGQRLSYGEAAVPSYRFDQAKMIVSIDADFLGTWLTPVAFNRQFSAGRKDLNNMSRLVSFDSTYSLTGANADLRYKIKPSQQLTVVMGLIAAILAEGHSSYAQSEAVKAAIAPFADAATELKISADAFKKVAADLWKHAGESLVVAGGLATRTEDSLQLQIAVNFLNSLLGNEGKTVLAKGHSRLKASYEGLSTLIDKMQKGAVKTLIIHRVNPMYALSKDFGFEEALKKVNTVIYVGDKMNETALKSHLIATDNHSLETWNDSEFADGIYSIHQPLIRTMYDTRSFQLSLMTWAYMANQGPKRLTTYETFYDYLRAFWKEEMLPKLAKGKDFETFWNELLQKGVVGEAAHSAARSFKTEAFSQIKKKTVGSSLELALYPTVQLGDGTLANVAWLQELPDPVTKIVWDNYACLSLKTAESMKLHEGDLVDVKVGEKTLSLPTHIQPGLHDEVVAVAVGYGRTNAGSVGNGIGQNAYVLASVKNERALFAGLKAEVKKLGKHYDLVTTQGHDSMEGRQIVVQATNKDYQEKKDANIHHHHTWSIWSGHQYNGHKWGMAIDLNSCTGCSACMTACQSENNVHVVGKKYVMQGREMHWIRIDRYYTGDVENAEAVFQPVMCQHCDNAPCETVCPVAATVHSSEGLNEMVYNRCVGTRYCSNNCPYKVRRFNWFNYAKLIEKPMHMALNPEVGVRTRGVMEKCTFCVQRIKEGKNKAKSEGRPLKDGDIKVACETACPTDAITFGDMNDEKSRVAQIFKSEPRAYALLEEWYAKPSVRYLSKIRNNDKKTESAHHQQAQDAHQKQSAPAEGGHA